MCDDKVYLSPVMDLYNREIVSYSISLSPNLWQIREMFYGEKFESVNTFIEELKDILITTTMKEFL